MPSPTPEALALAGAYRLALADLPYRGPAGRRLGHGTGASLEFQDRREYVAGDDVRHVDWRAFARSEKLLVRLYREEVAPTVEVLVDVSRSMAIDAAKARLAVDLAALLAAVARAEGTAVRVIELGASPRVVAAELLEREGLELDATTPLAAALTAAGGLLRAGSVRVLVSDFLSPGDPVALVRALAARAGGVALVQVLGREDSDPPVGAGLRLEDAESGAALDIVLDRATVARYRERLERLRVALAEETRRVGGAFASVGSGDDVGAACRSELVEAGILAPA